MWSFVILTFVLINVLFITFGLIKREEIIANWKQYRENPVYLFSAYLYKPSEDKRSRLQFTVDNFWDVINSMIVNVFKIVLDPIFKVFFMFSHALTTTLDGILGIRGLLQTFWKKFNTIIDVFMRRFSATFHRLRVTYQTLLTSMQRITGISIAGVFQAMSAIYGTMSMIDLIIRVIIVILLILVAIIIFLFLFLWPVIPVIIVVIGILVAAGFGAAVGGMASTFCFEESTQIAMADGTTTSISNIHVGDLLLGETRVTAVMEFEPCAAKNAFYSLHGIRVSGSHIVYHNSIPIFVRDHPDAVAIETPQSRIFCLNTTTRKIPVWSSVHESIIPFADWEELCETDTEGKMQWNREVYQTLNPGAKWVSPTSDSLQSESAVHPDLTIQTPNGSVPICKLRPGVYVTDNSNQPTRVVGIVRIKGDEILAVDRGISCGAWVQESGDLIWKQPQGTTNIEKGREWISLFTESGTYKIADGRSIRDFTDVGSAELPTTYEWILPHIEKFGIPQ